LKIVINKTQGMSKTYESKSYNLIRERKEWEKNPQWSVILKEILQNIPWSPVLRNILVRVTKLQNPNGREFTLEVLDNDVGCTGDIYEASLLKEETKDGFNVTKVNDNKHGQGTQNLPYKTSDNCVYLEMRQGDEITSVTMLGDENRTRTHETLATSDTKIESNSGFYIKLNFSIPSYKKKISKVEDVVDLFYNVLKNDCGLNLNRVDVKYELIGFDNATLSKYPDRNKLQNLKEAYYTDESCVDTTNDKPITKDNVRVPINVNGDEMVFPHVKIGKRVGLHDAMNRFSIDENTYRSSYSGSNYGDTPRIRLFSNKTKLPYWEGTFPNRGKSNRNGADIDFYFDMHDDIWNDGSQTKNPFLEKGGLMEEKILEKAIEMWEEIFPSETDAEDAYQLFLFEKFTADKLTKSVKDFFERIGLGFYNKLSKTDRLTYITKEDKKGHVRFDFSLRNLDEKKIPTEVKPKAFKSSEYRQVLDYYTLSDKEIEIVVMIGIDVKDTKISDFNEMVKQWKDGKMSKSANFVYIDGAYEFDYDNVQKAAYIKKVQQLRNS
jgi:hypothetical protein